MSLSHVDRRQCCQLGSANDRRQFITLASSLVYNTMVVTHDGASQFVRVYTARRYASTLHAAVVCLSGCQSMRLARVGYHAVQSKNFLFITRLLEISLSTDILKNSLQCARKSTLPTQNQSTVTCKHVPITWNMTCPTTPLYCRRPWVIVKAILGLSSANTIK